MDGEVPEGTYTAPSSSSSASRSCAACTSHLHLSSATTSHPAITTVPCLDSADGQERAPGVAPER